MGWLNASGLAPAPGAAVLMEFMPLLTILPGLSPVFPSVLTIVPQVADVFPGEITRI